MPPVEMSNVMTGASAVGAWLKDNVTVVVGILIFAYVVNRVVSAVQGKRAAASATTTITKNPDGSTNITIE